MNLPPSPLTISHLPLQTSHLHPSPSPPSPLPPPSTPQVCARCLGIPVERVFISETSTATVANSSPTAASFSTDLYGMATKVGTPSHRHPHTLHPPFLTPSPSHSPHTVTLTLSTPALPHIVTLTLSTPALPHSLHSLTPSPSHSLTPSPSHSTHHHPHSLHPPHSLTPSPSHSTHRHPHTIHPTLFLTPHTLCALSLASQPCHTPGHATPPHHSPSNRTWGCGLQ